MLKRIVKMTFRPDETDVFIGLFESKKSLIRNFDGCKYLELVRDINNPAIFFTISIWDTDNSLQNYRRSDLFKTTWEETKALFSEPAEAWSTESLFAIN